MRRGLGGIVIQTIEHIDRIGTLHGLDGSAFPLAGLSLIYAVNGCGKSTLAAVLAAAGSGDGHALTERRSLGTTGDPHARLLLADGTKRVLNNGTWAGVAPHTHVFDTQFVDQNVHTGGEVSPSHRQGLLGIVIGQTAVEQQEALEAAQLLVVAAKDEVLRLDREVVAMAHAIDPATTLSVFEDIQVLDEEEAQTQLEKAEAALTAGRSVSQILALPMPSELPHTEVDLTDFSEALGEPLSALHAEARHRVAEHMAHIDAEHNALSPESWLRTGLTLAPENECPFCGQSTVGIELIDLYAEFFDTAYGDLRQRVDRLRVRLGGSAQENRSKFLTAEYERSRAAAAAWASHVAVSALPELDAVTGTLSSIGALVDDLIRRKIDSFEKPLDADGDDDTLTVFAHALPLVVEDVNAAVRVVREEISVFRGSLTVAGVPQLERELAGARLASLRRSDDVVRLLADRSLAKKEVRKQEGLATKARAASKAAMNQTLSEFELVINGELIKMAAQFTIEKVTSSFVGGTSRGNYGLNLRGTSIDVSSGIPPFRLALSEGDKRTLAFAFFCAIVLRESDLRGHVVVVDDPVTSLDAHRRRHTTNTLNEMSLRGAQVIVLAHDATYLRDVRQVFSKKKKDNYNAARTSTELQLKRPSSSDSMLLAHDLDRECESTYFRHYRRLRLFVSGESEDGALVDHIVAANAVRPLVEGYLHRRFPGRVPEKTLGAVIIEINQSTAPDVLLHAKPLVPELSEINDWAAGLHHDTQSDYAGQSPDPHEVVAFALRALKVVHGEP
jgi:wobble nucleotide-excising tRNase